MQKPSIEPRLSSMTNSPVLRIEPLSTPWQTTDPFLFCMHHNDQYPAGNEQMGPQASLAGRHMGQDFSGRDGWSMYHGEVVPGFPQHPHRGFETVTIARQGLIDHSDSLGATARFGRGDVQWLTAGQGIVHSEMFPLVESDKPNPTELFQIWLNLPRKNKMVEPYFSMFWGPQIPHILEKDANGRSSTVSVIAGGYRETQALNPPPHSWASEPESHVAIWTLRLDAHAQLTLPSGPREAKRTLYFFAGSQLKIAGQTVQSGVLIEVDTTQALVIENGDTEAELLVLQGRPLAEPVARYGPFVMNTPEEIQQAFRDYQRTRFGGWPFASHAPAHPRERGRFALHADGRIEEPEDV